MSTRTEMVKTSKEDVRGVEDATPFAVNVYENIDNVQTTPTTIVDNCEGVIVQVRSSLEIDNAAIFSFIDFAECVAEFVESVVRSYHDLLALARCVHDAEFYKMQCEINSNNNEVHNEIEPKKVEIEHLSCNNKDQEELIQDMLTLFYHILSPYDVVYHHPCWLFVNEEVQLTLADRINYLQEWWRCHRKTKKLEESRERLIEQTKTNPTEQLVNDSKTESSTNMTSLITTQESFMPAEFIVMMWNELYNTLGASWRQRKRLFRNLDWTFQYHANHYTFVNVYESGSHNKRQKHKEKNNKFYNPENNKKEEEDGIAFGPLTPACIGVSTSSRCAIRCPLNSFWRTLAVVPLEINKNTCSIDNYKEESHTYLFDETDEDVALSHAIPYLSPQSYYNYVNSYNQTNTTNDNTEDTEVYENEKYEKSTRIAHSYSDDVWNVSILILEVALCGFDVSCLMPRQHATYNYCKPHNSSLYTEIIHILISEHHILPQAAYNFVYASLYHFERLVLSEEYSKQELQREHESEQNMKLSPEYLAQQWLLYLRKAYGNDFVFSFFRKEVVSRALRWRRQDRWNAFISTFDRNIKREKKNKNIEGNCSSLLEVANTPHFYESEHMAALISLPSVKQLQSSSKIKETVNDKPTVPLWNHFELSWWEECRSWIKKVVNQSIAELDVRACNSTYRRITFDTYLYLITHNIASMFVSKMENFTNKLPFCIAMHPFLRKVRKLQQMRLLHLATRQTFINETEVRNSKTDYDSQLYNSCHHNEQLSSIFLSSSFIHQFTSSANDELHRRELHKQVEMDEDFLEWEEEEQENTCNDMDEINVDLDKYLADLHLSDLELHSDELEREEEQQEEIVVEREVEEREEVHKTNDEDEEVTLNYTELENIAELRSVLLKEITSWQDETNNINDMIKSPHVVNDFLVQKYWEWYFVKDTIKRDINNNKEWEQWLVHSPIPPTLRSACWFTLLQIPLCPSMTTKLTHTECEHLIKNKINYSSEELYEEKNNDYLEEEYPSDVHSCVLSFERQLSVDLPRCHQESSSLLHTPEAHASLRRCIRGWYRLNNEEWSYWQGIDSLAAVLFSITPFDEKIVTLELHEIIQTFVAHDIDHDPHVGHNAIHFQSDKSGNVISHRKPLKDMHDSLHALTVLLHYIDPELAHHLFHNVKCDVHLFAVGWFVTLFAHHFTLDEVYLIWDVLLSHSFHYAHCLLCIAAAFIEARRSSLLEGDFVSCLSALNHINGKHSESTEKCKNRKNNIKDNNNSNIAYIHSVLSMALSIMYAFPSSVIEQFCSAPYYINSHECVYTCSANTYSDEVKRTTWNANNSNTTSCNTNTSKTELYMLELTKAQEMYSVLLLPVSVIVSAFRHEPLRWDFMASDNVYHDRPPHWTDSGVFLVEVDIITNGDTNNKVNASKKETLGEMTWESCSSHNYKLCNKELVGALHVTLDLRTITITNEELIQRYEKLEKHEQEEQEEGGKQERKITSSMEYTKEKEEKVRVHEEQNINLSHIERTRLMQDAAVTLSEQLHHAILATIPPLSVYCANDKRNNKQSFEKNTNNLGNSESATDANTINDLINAPHVILVRTICNNTDICTSRDDPRMLNQRSKSALEQDYLYLQEFAMQLQKFKVPHVSILFGGQSALYDALPHLYV